MQTKIREALALLDTSEDGHWTSQGLPAMDVVRELVGEPVKRGQVEDAAPGFSRDNPSLDGLEPAYEGEGVTIEVNAEGTEAQGSKGDTDESVDPPKANGQAEDVAARRRALDAEVAELDRHILDLKRRRTAVKDERDKLVVVERAKQPSREEVFKRKCEEDFRRQFEQAKRQQELAAKNPAPYEHPVDRAMRTRKVEYPVRDPGGAGG